MHQADNTIFIDSQPTLVDYCQSIASSPWLALDTEFVRERTYDPHLCLIQVAANNGQIACIDALAIKDLGPLYELLAKPEITKILHAVSQDLEVLYLNSAPPITPLFDTQLAAGFLGLGDQIGYAGLVRQLLEVELAKGQARTDWSRRPLSQDQLSYAADDVRYLGTLYEQLAADLKAKGRDAWLAEDIGQLSQPENYQPQPENAWRRLKGLGRLPVPAQHRAARLAAWREQRAIAKNRPRRWILADAPLLALAVAAPVSLDELTAIIDLPAKLIQSQGAELLDLLLAPVNDDQPLVLDRDRPDAEARALQKRIKAALKDLAQELDMTPSLLATRGHVEALAQGRLVTSVFSGWRADVIGASLSKLLPPG